MIVIPTYVLTLIPPLIVWWVHNRCERREYTMLAFSLITTFISLLILASSHERVTIWYDGPRASRGIMTIQLPMALVATTLVAALPLKMRMVRNLIAVIVGEMTLFFTGGLWIS